MKELYNTYLFKALDSYPYDLVEAIEALNYAMSYDDKNPIALALMAKLYKEQLKDYDTAKEYFELALAEDIYAVSIYPDYISLLIWTEDYNRAIKLIDFALTIKGIDKALIYFNKSYWYEVQGEYKSAMAELKFAKKFTYNNYFMDSINEAKERIKSKMPKKKNKQKSNKKDKNKSKKK